jgi:cysteine-rich repeat protein
MTRRWSGFVGIAIAMLSACVIEEDGAHDCSRCGDGVVDVDEKCDDGNIYDGDGCSSTCAIEPRCGDGMVTSGELCDDGNAVDGDQCESDCTLPVCGNGIVDQGEVCDDGNASASDACTPSCELAPLSTRPPQVVSGTLMCTTAAGFSGRKIAVDASLAAYVVMNCGGNAYVSRSTDLGITWSAPQPLGITNVSELAVHGGAADTAYVAAVTFDSTLVFASTADRGATWSSPRILDSQAASTQVSIASRQQDVYIQVTSFSQGRRLWRNGASGVGAFTSTEIASYAVFHDVLVDDTGAVWSAGDDPTYRLVKSSDGGATFGTEQNPPGMAYYSDWGYGAGKLFAMGSNGTIDIIPTNAPTTSTTITGLTNFDISFNVRALSVDTTGNAYIVSQVADGSLALDRLVANAAALDATNRKFPTGHSASVAAVSTNAAFVAYTDNTRVYVTVQVY